MRLYNYRVLAVFLLGAILLVCNCDSGDQSLRRGPVWTDADAGLVWQIFASSAAVDVGRATAICAGINLDGRGNWRLPTIEELRTLTSGCADVAPGGHCGVTGGCASLSGCDNFACYKPCVIGAGPADGCWQTSEVAGVCGAYWSATAVTLDPDNYWTLDFSDGSVLADGEASAHLVRCVRSL